jgi:hypothetical protein
VKRFFTPLLAVAFICAGYVISTSHSFSGRPYFGDADAIGADEDAYARENYEWMQLHDPATGRIPGHIREREIAFAANLPTDAAYSRFSKTTGLSWQQRGPWNVGGRTRALGMDINNENILVAGSCSGGMWRSTDQGTTWTPTTPANDYKSVSCLAQDTRSGHTNTWYYGTGEAYGASAAVTGAYYLGNGIYKSTDDGITWTALSSTVGASLTALDTWGDLVWNVVTDASNATQDVVYAAAYGGIYRSADGGTTWTRVVGSSTVSYFTDVAVTKTGVVYASLSSDGGHAGLYRSADGITFTNITPAGFATSYNRVKIGISPSDETQVYFLGNTPGSGTPDTNFLGQVEWNSLWRYTYISGNGTGTGGNWQNRSANLPSTGGLFDKFTSQGSYDLVVKVKPDDTATVFIGGTNLYRSTSGFADNSHTAFIGGYLPGATLPVVANYPSHHPDQHELVFFPSNADKMLSSNDGGIFKTGDNTASSVAWSPLNNGYITTMFYTCTMDHATTNDIIIGGAQDNGSWYTNSSTLTSPWVTPRGGDGSFCAIADNGAAYYFSIQNGKMMRAKVNASGAVDSFARIDPIGGHGYQFSNPYVLDPNNNNIMYLIAGTALWRNNNLAGIPYAGNWDSISTNWTMFPDTLTLTTGATLTAVAVSKTPANRVYYGTSAKRIYRVDNANIGTPTATDITSTSVTAAFPSGGNVSCIAIDPTNADNIMVVFSNYNVYSLFYSSNGGTSWTKVGGNLESGSVAATNGPSCRWASIIPVSGGTVYLVGTSVGLFATTALSGTSTVWTQQGASNIGAAVIDMIDYRATDGLVAIATHSSGIYTSHITSVSDVSVPTVTANGDFNLITFPNPFTTYTNIEFTLKEYTQASIKIYDAMGRLVKVVADQPMNAGKQHYLLSRDNLSNGIYYCTLNTNGSVQTHSIIIN